MAQLVTLVSFDDLEREVLGAGDKERRDAAAVLSKAINVQIREAFTAAGRLADSNPSREDLAAMRDQLEQVRSIVNLVPTAEGAEVLRNAVSEIDQIVGSAQSALASQ